MYTMEQYLKLKEAIATGATTVHYGDKTVTYRSLAEMLQILGMMEDELFPERRIRHRKLAVTDRGYYPTRRCRY